MRTNLRATMAGAVAAVLATAGCGAASWDDEERLIPDSEIDAMQTELVSTPAGTPSETAAHVKVVWGYLSGKFRDVPGWIDWTGSLSVDSGKATLESLVFFDAHDTLQPQSVPNQIDFESRTMPHYDGLGALLEPGSPADVVHLDTASFSTDLAAADLAKGVNLHFVVDADGHEVSITSLPAGACGGFAYGYQKKASKGWLGFGGRFADATGAVTGRLRFRADGDTLKARLLDENREIVAEGTGTLSGQDFELSLQKPDGTAMATVKGIYQPPSYSVRGAFQATWRCP
ncbi:MAG TPA: hypothetical protein VGK67_37360 [Myxococcales bacterium]